MMTSHHRTMPFMKRSPHSSGTPTAGRADVAQAVTIEDACKGVNRINDRIKRDRRRFREEERLADAKAKVTLPSSISDWLSKPMPQEH